LKFNRLSPIDKEDAFRQEQLPEKVSSHRMRQATDLLGKGQLKPSPTILISSQGVHAWGMRFTQANHDSQPMAVM
jgi:hypothetical protein